jgi:hypothetical protein
MPLFSEFIVNVIKNTTTSINDLNEVNIRFYPNPTRNFIRIEGSAKLESVEILDIRGKLLHKYAKPTSDIDVSEFPKGTYIVKMSTTNNFKSQKLLID